MLQHKDPKKKMKRSDDKAIYKVLRIIIITPFMQTTEVFMLCFSFPIIHIFFKKKPDDFLQQLVI